MIISSMKNLRNVSIYYIIVGILCALSFVFFSLGIFAFLGLILLITYWVLKYLKIDRDHFIRNAKLRFFVVAISYLLPLLWYASISLYGSIRQYKVFVPNNFDGVVTLPYIENNDSNFIAFFQALKLYPKEKIDVNKDGLAKSVLIYNSNKIPFLGGGSGIQLAETGICFYKNEDTSIKMHLNAKDVQEIKKTIPKMEVYYVGWSNHKDSQGKLQFVVTKPESYSKYFYTEQEKELLRKSDSVAGKPYDIDYDLNFLK